MKHYYIKGRCVDLNLPPDIFYPDEDHKGRIAYAKAICQQCTVRDECLDLALSNWEEFGIWGGLTPKERKQVKVREALQSHASPHKKPHEQEHPMNASHVSPSCIPDEETRSPLASHLVLAQQLASRVIGIEVSLLQSPGELSSGPNQNSLFERLLDEFSSFQEQLSQRPGYNPESLLKVNHELFQIPEPSDFDLAQIEQDPILLIPLGLFQEVS